MLLVAVYSTLELPIRNIEARPSTNVEEEVYT